MRETRLASHFGSSEDVWIVYAEPFASNIVIEIGRSADLIVVSAAARLAGRALHHHDLQDILTARDMNDALLVRHGIDLTGHFPVLDLDPAPDSSTFGRL